MSKKDTLTADAQKFLQKGQTEKALSCYREVLTLDPGDQRVRQRLAELLAKSHHNDEARKEFETIGRNLASNGFYLKAIAVYKQIERLFPEDIGIALTLASLNEKHGLSANALAEYKRAYEYYEKAQDRKEALNILEAMQRIDSFNPNIKLKYAEVLLQDGDKDAALEVFQALGQLLVDRRDEPSLTRLAERMTQLFPDKSDFLSAVLRKKLNTDTANFVAALLKSVIKKNPHSYDAWHLLIMAFRITGNTPLLKASCQHFIKYFPEELFPRENLINSLIEDQDAEGALSTLDECEQLFIEKNAASILLESYIKLNDIIPFNVRIMKGCARLAEAAGKSSLSEEFIAKIGAIASVSNPSAVLISESESGEEAFEPELLETQTNGDELLTFSGDGGGREFDIHDFADTSNDLYEIEIELDEEPAENIPVSDNKWFETVNDIFGTIQTETGKVRFAPGIDNADAQSSYDLGLAFYEMGIYDEAINSFRQAAEAPERRLACMILQGACLREKGDLELAETALSALSESPELSAENACALKYELALTYTAMGNGERARQLLEEIEAVNPAFRDVAKRLQISPVQENEEHFDFSEDELLGFDIK